MSEQSLTEVSVPISVYLEKNIGNSLNGTFGKNCVDNGNHAKENTTVTSCMKFDSVKEVDATNNGMNPVNPEVEYVESENLTDLSSLEDSLSTLIERLDSKDWIVVCESLNNVRQISIYHKERLLEMLDKVLVLLVKSLKNPRSAVCKTAIMASADVFKAYGDRIVDSIDPLLIQLLLKSSQDKRFVCEAAEKALISLTSCIAPSLLLSKLQPYLKHKNPRIRAKTSMCLSRSVSRLGIDGIKSYGIDKLIQIAASQLSDQLPESREAARILAVELQAVYMKTCVQYPEDPEQCVLQNAWEDFCNSKLSPLSAQAVLRVTSIAKEGLVASC